MYLKRDHWLSGSEREVGWSCFSVGLNFYKSVKDIKILPKLKGGPRRTVNDKIAPKDEKNKEKKRTRFVLSWLHLLVIP